MTDVQEKGCFITMSDAHDSGADYSTSTVKFYDEPEIHLLAQPHVVPHYEWLGEKQPKNMSAREFMPGAHDGDELVETGGRACYWSYGNGRKTNEDYIDHLLDAGHGSVLEHPCWTFGLKGISRSLSHELVRHRHLSFSQLSQRYVKDTPEFVVPPGLLPTERLTLEEACQSALATYNDLLRYHADNKRGRETARAVLPNCTATRIVVTGNARALRHMLTLRGSLGADAEFRRLAIKWTELMKKLAPNIFADFSISKTIQGEPFVLSGYGCV